MKTMADLKSTLKLVKNRTDVVEMESVEGKPEWFSWNAKGKKMKDENYQREDRSKKSGNRNQLIDSWSLMVELRPKLEM